MLASFTTAPVFSQPVAPVASSYTLGLDQFSTHTGSRAIDVVAPHDGSGRVFVSAQSGEIFSYGADGTLLNTFVDLASTTANTGFLDNAGSFRGLMYFDFHPDYDNPNADGYRKVYTGFQSNPSFATAEYSRTRGSSVVHYVIGEWQVSSTNANQIDTSTYREVIRFEMEGNNPHGLGEVAFNPLAKPGDADYGLLYAAVGDANTLGNSNPGSGYIQNLSNPFGKIIRINPLEDTVNGADYSTPGNPYNSVSGAAPENYAIGFRDPQTFSFAKDNSGETVLITFDIGASNRDEVDLVRAGQNYGWERYEGTLDLNPDRPLVPGSTHALPVLEYDHSQERFAIIGGLLVSDPNNPDFQDQVIFSNLVGGEIFHADFQEMLDAEANGTQAQIYEMTVTFDGESGTFADVLDGVDGGRGDARFGYDENGNVYIVSKQTGVIFETGLVTSVPEPSSIALLGLGGLLLSRRRRGARVISG
ncbi:MAG: PQQ-dependent sugar dehydrogenase [Phycisphaeraceae bacterium]|nr:PQQ-dependent sugar dehydrogenase [Phycisphaeraceae bacterium]